MGRNRDKDQGTSSKMKMYTGSLRDFVWRYSCETPYRLMSEDVNEICEAVCREEDKKAAILKELKRLYANTDRRKSDEEIDEIYKTIEETSAVKSVWDDELWNLIDKYSRYTPYQPLNEDMPKICEAVRGSEDMRSAVYRELKRLYSEPED